MDNVSLENRRHSLAHLLSAAVLELFPGAKNSIGPAIDSGFYYDFDDLKISDADLPNIEKKMREMVKSWETFTEIPVTVDEAKKIFADNPYKLELIGDIAAKGEKLTLYYSGPESGVPSSHDSLFILHNSSFIDLCRGGHVTNPKKDIPADGWKLDRIAGAYWRGDEKNKMLTRIYGLAFSGKEELQAYLKQRETAGRNDHRKLGKELKIFTFDDDVGPGLPMWLPNGTVIIDELETLARKTEAAAGYSRVRTPHIAKESMYTKSGHLPYYEDSMFPPMEYEGGKYYLRAMNCPHHHKIFAAEQRSYRDLPLRLAEYGTVYRHEKSGELFGLMRVRMLSMNDAHIYCAEEQFADEFRAVNDMYLRYFKIFGIEKYQMRFSTHDPKRLGEKFVNEPALWEKTENRVRQALTESKIPFVEVPNEAAFYGPKIDVQVWSAIGREFTLATNQVDFAQPRRFNLTYTDREGKPQTPLVIHRAPLGTHERFIGFLIEHYGGAFPFWLSPVQVKILPVSEKFLSYAKTVHEKLKDQNIRSELDESNETLGKKIRQAKLEKIPYFIVVGEKEAAGKTATLESRDAGKIGMLPIEKLFAALK
ncbi:MAG: threonine--tRNA ligase [Candidatus Taylorbacteria bacterium RIFCSPHIGHO2_02_49_25]|uniref:Threonine--tRNA ligase n=1 Tax=Candidatus Taylorbacteria bacterium RIFCSPHIGHO2_02_49_25 TaxID=1802305 RepID=A0A1G2MED1_9BACT|nr:MAG: Threonine-tRNA ligase [Parcubacteria group bacterium GW2011_GWF2_50_9]OHA19057.1 MAG: threonine--tRNA ligase [Candidatus Taylorbacteria bacterium RIFCSPHIGHO2_01_FULL_49_60]OHA22227.1 MAG: threonine--tRNA ligase [Candidatus Taylorbacteria bacterium RIFCSPHIGHO2_02_49_25]OHA35172.1 MAG: threonine--tRNA ligase [Candidatus Taylorbacteria bacterium RIFCSPLOWO2_01_FULL_50_130]OHA36101.1 MAG: threonine--tRNA ligase [Candidatus Taylorbacteria bacterium RIFCSPLOWO2_02_50_13]OHA40949.1 MAG: thr